MQHGGFSSGTQNFGGGSLHGTTHLGNSLHTPTFSHSHAFSPLGGNSRSNTSNFLGTHGVGHSAAANHLNSGLGSSRGGHQASALLNHQMVSHSSLNGTHGGQFLSHHAGNHQLATAGGAGHHQVGTHTAGFGNGRQFGNGHNGMHHGFHNHGFFNRNFFFGGFGGFGFGWGWGGFWGFGYPYWGYGYYGWPGLLTYGLLGLGNYFGGYGGYGYGGYGYGGYYGGMGYAYDPYCYYGNSIGYPGTAVANPQDDALAAANQAPAVNPKPGTKDADNAKVFAEKGETDFKARDYKAAVYAWKHAVVDDPNNGVLVMMLGQGFFATGQFNEAAGAVQQAMQILPKDDWGVVVKNYKELYSNIQDFTDQLRALEKAVKEKPNDPALRFLAGFQYAYLGYPKEAVDQLEKGLKAAPRDEMAKKLRDEMAAKLKPAEPPTPGLK
jgi:Tfp pilus assembly protein PilF